MKNNKKTVMNPLFTILLFSFILHLSLACDCPPSKPPKHPPHVKPHPAKPPKPPALKPPYAPKPPVLKPPPSIPKPPVVKPPRPPIMPPGTPCPPPPPPSSPYPSPPKAPETCPIDTLKLGACVDVLGGLVNIVIGKSHAQEVCCPVLSGLVDLDAAICLCTTIKARLLNVNLIIPIALEVLVDCGKTPPPGFKCPA